MGGKPVRIFLDTNVLVYATQETSSFHNEARRTLLALDESNAQFWISRQVLREYMAVLSRPQTYVHPLEVTTIVDRVRIFEDLFRVADETAAVTSRLLALLREIPAGGKQIHDANIVATMLAYHIPTLITHNVRDFARYRGKITLQALVASD